jgi:hypothetical protein
MGQSIRQGVCSMRSNSALTPMLAGFPDGPKNRLCAVLSPAIQPCLDETGTLKPEAIDDIVLCKNSAILATAVSYAANHAPTGRSRCPGSLQ